MLRFIWYLYFELLLYLVYLLVCWKKYYFYSPVVNKISITYYPHYCINISRHALMGSPDARLETMTLV